jgi:hypothetical protein
MAWAWLIAGVASNRHGKQAPAPGGTKYRHVTTMGRLINSFALIYPAADKRRFDAIVEGIQATFRPGRNCEDLPGRPARHREVQLPRGPRSAFADRIARQRGHDVIGAHAQTDNLDRLLLGALPVEAKVLAIERVAE